MSTQVPKRRAPGGERHKRKLRSINEQLAAGTITAERAESISSFLGYYQVNSETNQLVLVLPPRPPQEAQLNTTGSIHRPLHFNPSTHIPGTIPRPPTDLGYDALSNTVRQASLLPSSNPEDPEGHLSEWY